MIQSNRIITHAYITTPLSNTSNTRQTRQITHMLSDIGVTISTSFFILIPVVIDCVSICQTCTLNMRHLPNLKSA